MTRSRFLGVVVGAMALAAACTSPPSTELVVVVASDYAPGDEIARLVIVTSDEAGAPITTREVAVTAAASATSVTIPFSFGVTPSGAAGRPLRIEVSAFEAGASDPFVVRRAVAPFVTGQTRRLVIYLERICEGVTCDAASTCVHGACVTSDVPIESLDGVVPETELAVDGGTFTPDASPGPSCAASPSCDGAAHVEVGVGFACALRRMTGHIACWGSEAALGQLGDGATEPSQTPVEVVGIDSAWSLGLGDRFACATSESQAWCWGDDGLGELGAGDAPTSATPMPLPFSATRLFAGASTMCAAGAPSVCWGAGVAGLSLTLADDCGGTA